MDSDGSLHWLSDKDSPRGEIYYAQRPRIAGAPSSDADNRYQVVRLDRLRRFKLPSWQVPGRPHLAYHPGVRSPLDAKPVLIRSDDDGY